MTGPPEASRWSCRCRPEWRRLRSRRSDGAKVATTYQPRFTTASPVVLGDRRLFRRLRGPARQAWPHALRSVAGAARQTSGLPAADGLALPWVSFYGSALTATSEWRTPNGSRKRRRRLQLHGGRSTPATGEESSHDAFSRSIAGTDWQPYRRDGPGVSAFAFAEDTIYHAYSADARRLDALCGMYQWLAARRSAATRTVCGGTATTNTTS